MALINYSLPKGVKDFQSVHCRLRKGRETEIRLVLKNLSVPQTKWNATKQTVKVTPEIDYLEVNRILNGFREHIEMIVHNDVELTIDYTSDWLRSEYEKFLNIDFNDAEVNDKIYVSDYFQKFNDNLNHFRGDKTRAKYSDNTKKDYVTAINKLKDYEAITKKLRFNALTKNWCNAYISYLEDELQLSGATINTNLNKLKHILKLAKAEGLLKNDVSDYLRVNEEESFHTYLTKNELEQIKNADIPQSSYDNVRDWFLIQCAIGQRLSDLKRLTKRDVYVKQINGSEVTVIALKQQKTDERIEIPVSETVTDILSKNNGNFPRVISDQKYNKYVQEVCKISGINTITKGAVKRETSEGSKVYRKIEGNYEKWELISSHTARRTFATLHYQSKTLSTRAIMLITGHKSERTFYDYIRATKEDLMTEFVSNSIL